MNEDSPRDGVGRANDAQQSAHREFPSRSSRRRRAAHPHLHHRTGQQPGASRNSSAPLSEQAEKSEATDSLQPRRSLRSRAASLSRPTLRPTQASRAASRPHWYGTADPRVKDLSPAQKARIRNPRLSMRDHDDAYDATSPTTTLTHMPAIKPITGATPIISTKRSNSSPATSSEGDPAPSRASRAGSSPAVASAPAAAKQDQDDTGAKAAPPAVAATAAASSSTPVEKPAEKVAGDAGSSAELKRQESRWWLGASIVVCLLALIAGVVFGFFKLAKPNTEAQVLPSDKTTSASASETPSPSPSPSPEPTPIPTVRTTEVPSGLKGTYTPPASTGRMIAIPGQKAAPEGDGQQIAYDLSYEQGMPIDPNVFANSVHSTLNDNRSWPAQGMRFVRTDYQPQVSLRLVSPNTIKKECAGTVDDGFASCLVGNRVLLNSDRWFTSAKPWDQAGGGQDEYRAYLLNYFVGLATGKKQVDCKKSGEVANVMQSQTYELNGCKPNGWVNPDAKKGQ